MTATRWKSLCRSLPRRLCAGLTLLCYLATALNLPLPLPAAARRADEPPFPCQDHTCGCQTAAQCWTGCCCMTPEQRWAWAREHQVEPPAYAEKPRSTSWSMPRQRDRDQHAPSCCTRTGASTAKSSCCQQAPPAPDEAPSPSKAPGKVRWVLTMAGLKCQGHSTLWISAAALPPSPPLTWQPCWAVAGRLACGDDSATFFRAPPAAPPPRTSAS